MRILVIGGTSFVGRHLVQRALDREHDVTVFNRGRTGPELFPDAHHLQGDRDDDLSALDDGEWDATIDVCAYVHRQVRTLLETLGDRAGHYTLVSTISAIGSDVPAEGFTEDAPTLEPDWSDVVDMAHYGELKVACEEVARRTTDRLLVVRPGYVVGPYDVTRRFPYWVERVARGGVIAGPDEHQPLQAVDGRDLAMFTIGAVERDLVDTVHVTAPEHTDVPHFADVLRRIAEGVGAGEPDVRWVGARDELPLSAPQEWWPKMRADISRARGHGLWTRPLAETAADTWRWICAERDAGRWEHRRGIGLEPEDERRLVAAADQ